MFREFFAKVVSRIAHRNQKYGTQPYSYHIDGVVERVRQTTLSKNHMRRAIILAYLHDVIEDAEIPVSILKVLFGAETVSDIKVITRSPKETYKDYIIAIKSSGNIVVQTVKLCDLKFNVSNLSESNSLIDRYKKAIEYLEWQS